MIISISPKKAFFKFRVTLSNRFFIIHMKWSTRYEFYSVDIYEGETPIILGRGLHPNIDLFSGLNLGIGRLYLSGAVPTIENLGNTNSLIYEPET